MKDGTLFLHSPDLVNDATIKVSGFRPRLMCVGEDGLDKANEPPALNTFEGVHYGMIDGDCDRNFVTKNTASITVGLDTYYEFDWTARTNGWDPDWRIIGAYMTVVGEEGLVGLDKYSQQYYQIIGFTAGATNKIQCRFVPDIKTSPDILAQNMLLTVNPVVLKVQTANLPGGGGESGFYTNKEVGSMGVMMSGVELSGAITGLGANSNASFGRWYGNHYFSDSFTTVQSSTPVNPSKTTSIISVVDGPSPIHAAFVRKLGPHQSVEFAANVVGMNFRLLAMNVRGRILDTERNTNSYV